MTSLPLGFSSLHASRAPLPLAWRSGGPVLRHGTPVSYHAEEQQRRYAALGYRSLARSRRALALGFGVAGAPTQTTPLRFEIASPPWRRNLPLGYRLREGGILPLEALILEPRLLDLLPLGLVLESSSVFALPDSPPFELPALPL